MGKSLCELLSIISMTCLYDFIDFDHDLVCLWYQEIRGDKIQWLFQYFLRSPCRIRDSLHFCVNLRSGTPVADFPRHRTESETTRTSRLVHLRQLSLSIGPIVLHTPASFATSDEDSFFGMLPSACNGSPSMSLAQQSCNNFSLTSWLRE